MMQVLTIDIHSFIDVITNSSTELFVCAEQNTLDAVNAVLEDKGIQGLDKPFIFSREEFHKNKDNYMGNSPYSMLNGFFYDDLDPNLDEKLRKYFIEHEPYEYNSWPRPEDKGYWRDELRKTPYRDKHIFIDRHCVIDRVYKEIVEGTVEEPWWWDNPRKHENSHPISDIEGKVIIIGKEDNSIDWEDMDTIESIFNANRYHLG